MSLSQCVSVVNMCECAECLSIDSFMYLFGSKAAFCYVNKASPEDRGGLVARKANLVNGRLALSVPPPARPQGEVCGGGWTNR